MLMKYKDFKAMSQEDMKNVKGGVTDPENSGGTHVCGTEYSGNQCFCDYCFTNGSVAFCHQSCYYTNCTGGL